jgi:hypothetical protein
MKLFQILPSLFFALAIAFGLTGCDIKRDSGVWQGTVVVREDDGRPDTTCQMEINLTHTDETVTIHHLYTACEAFASRWQGDTYEVHGMSLFYNGRDVGWVRGDGSVTMELRDYEMTQRFPTLADKVMLSWTRVGDSLEFTEEVTFAGRKKRSSGWLRKMR